MDVVIRGERIQPGFVQRGCEKVAPQSAMPGHQCYHCKQWVEEAEPHDCWTTTESALTQDLPDDLREAWERLRETAAAFGEQRIYASHRSIMFSRKACYFFVRPKRHSLEVCVFLRHALKSPRIRRTDRASASKVVHFIDIRHRDEVEPPFTDWLRMAYDTSVETGAKRPAASKGSARTTPAKTSAQRAGRGKASQKRHSAGRRRDA